MEDASLGPTGRLTPRKFSRVLVPDARDADFRLAAGTSTRKSKTWRDTLLPLDQGDASSCVGHAWSHLLACSPITQYLNPFGIYELAKFRDEWKGERYDGTSVRAGASICRSLGLLTEYRWATTLDELIFAVLEIGPVVMGTDWYEGMSRPEGNVLEATGDNEGGHAWLISAVDVTKRRFRMKNSWGLDWADRGRAWLPFDTAAELLEANGDACIAIEQKPQTALAEAA